MQNSSLAPTGRLLGVLGVAALLAATVPGIAGATEFPFNGDFEMIHLGHPVGWQTTGSWLMRSQAAHHGRYGIMLRSDCSNRGDQLVSEGYLLVSPGGALQLRLDYISNSGGPSVGLQFCDMLGRPLGIGFVESLPPADGWTPFTREITLDPAKCPAGTAAVRVLLRTDRSGIQACLDQISLSCSDEDCSEPPAPKISVLTRPNLMPNPKFTVGEDGCMPGWSALSAPGFASASATVGTNDQGTGMLELKSSSAPTAWISAPVLLNGAVPYDLTVNSKPSECRDGQFTVMLRVLDPTDPHAVWLQWMEKLQPNNTTGEVHVPLPRLYMTNQPMEAQVALLLGKGETGQVAVTGVSLQPEAISVSVRSVATPAGGFRSPKDASLFISAVNNTYDALKPAAMMAVLDGAGNIITREKRHITIGARSAAYFPYKPKLKSGGDYTLQVRIVVGGHTIAMAQYGFKVQQAGSNQITG